MDAKTLESKLDALNKRVDSVSQERDAIKLENEKLKAERSELIKGFVEESNKNKLSENNALKQLGFTSLKDAIHKDVSARFGVNPGAAACLIDLKRDIQTNRLIKQLCHGAATDAESDVENPHGRFIDGFIDTKFAKERDLEARCKAFDTTDFADWVPTIVANNYISEYELEMDIHTKFRNITMPNQSYEMPLQDGVSVARKVAEGGTATAGTFAAAKLAFSAVKTFDYYPVTEELTEDSAPDFLSLAIEEVSKAQIRAANTWMINGATGAHIDSDTAALGADVAEKLGNGLRKLAILNSASGAVIDCGGTLTDTKMFEARAAMGKFGVIPAQCMIIQSAVGNLKSQALSNVVTLEKMGPQMATILKGALSSYNGLPIYINEVMRDDLNATGVYDGVTTNLTGMLFVNHRRFFYAIRRPIRVRVAYDQRAEYDRRQIVSYMRHDFQGRVQSAAEKSVVYLVNIG